MGQPVQLIIMSKTCTFQMGQPVQLYIMELGKRLEGTFIVCERSMYDLQLWGACKLILTACLYYYDEKTSTSLVPSPTPSFPSLLSTVKRVLSSDGKLGVGLGTRLD